MKDKYLNFPQDVQLSVGIHGISPRTRHGHQVHGCYSATSGPLCLWLFTHALSQPQTVAY